MKRSYTRAMLALSVSFACLSAFRPGNKAVSDFCGKITYDVLVESNSPMVDSRSLQEMYGNTMTMYIKKGNYKMRFNEGSNVKELLYRSSENRQYLAFHRAADSLFWRDCERDDSQVVYSLERKNAMTILGHNCNSLTFLTDWAEVTYYYDPEMHVDPRYFSEHGYAYMNLYFKMARAPFLMYIYDGGGIRKTYTAIKVEQQELDDTEFMPTDLPIASTALDGCQ